MIEDETFLYLQQQIFSLKNICKNPSNGTDGRDKNESHVYDLQLKAV